MGLAISLSHNEAAKVLGALQQARISHNEAVERYVEGGEAGRAGFEAMLVVRNERAQCIVLGLSRSWEEAYGEGPQKSAAEEGLLPCGICGRGSREAGRITCKGCTTERDREEEGLKAATVSGSEFSAKERLAIGNRPEVGTDDDAEDEDEGAVSGRENAAVGSSIVYEGGMVTGFIKSLTADAVEVVVSQQPHKQRVQTFTFDCYRLVDRGGYFALYQRPDRADAMRDELRREPGLEGVKADHD